MSKLFPVILNVDVYVPDPSGARSKRVPQRIVISIDAESPTAAASRLQTALTRLVNS